MGVAITGAPQVHLTRLEAVNLTPGSFLIGQVVA